MWKNASMTEDKLIINEDSYGSTARCVMSAPYRFVFYAELCSNSNIIQYTVDISPPNNKYTLSLNKTKYKC